MSLNRLFADIGLLIVATAYLMQPDAPSLGVAISTSNDAWAAIAVDTRGIPRVVSPNPNQRFLYGTAAPIRIAPPPGWIPSLYNVSIESKNAAGQWISFTTATVPASVAQSPTGFNAGPLRGSLWPAGYWRVRARIAQPAQSSWSEWVEFGVLRQPNVNDALKPGVKIK